MKSHSHVTARRKFTAIVLSAFALCCGLLGPSHAQEAPGIEIRTIGIPPYGIERGQNSSGVYFDIANLVAEEAGYSASNYIYPYARIINELKSGNCDMTIMFRYEELDDHVIYIAPLPSLQTVVVGVAGDDFDSIAGLTGKTIAYLRGAAFSDAIDADGEIFSQVTDDFDQGVRMLEMGRADAIIGPLAPIQSAARNAGVELGTPLIVAERTPWIQISKRSVGRISADRLAQVFGDIVSRGELENIRQLYGSND